MGVALSCCRNASSDTALITPDIETKRRRQAEAAEKRIREQESRGIKDPQRLKERRERLEKIERETGRGGAEPSMRWMVD